MVSTFTPNLNLNLMGTGDQSNAWGGVLNSQVFTNIDQALGSPFSPSVAGSSNYTLSATNALNLYHKPTGVLTGNIQYIFPANSGRIILFNNATTGSFSVTVLTSGGTGVVVPQGAIVWVHLNSNGNVAYIPFGTTCYQNIASATTTDIGSTQSQMVKITGTTTITGLGSSAVQALPLYFVVFGGALTLTYNASSLILPTSANITTATNDSALFLYLGSGNWQCLQYYPASGQPVAGTGTLGVANGGTGATSETAYAVLCGGTTSTGPFQSIAGLGTVGQVLTSNGAAALPTMQGSTNRVITVPEITDTTDIALNGYNTQTNIGSTASITIPTKGRIELLFTGEVIFSSGSTYLIMGIRIGSTNYWPISQSGGSGQVISSVYDQTGTSIYQGYGGVLPQGGTSNIGDIAIVGLDIESLGIPTGTQTVQVIMAKGNGLATTTVKGTVKTSRIYITTYDHS